MENLKELSKISKGVTISEAAQIIGISRSKIYKLINEKKIKTFQFVGMTRMKHEEIERFLKNPD